MRGIIYETRTISIKPGAKDAETTAKMPLFWLPTLLLMKFWEVFEEKQSGALKFNIRHSALEL